MATNQEPKLMSAEALATHLGVTEQTVRRWIERGDLPAEKHGRTYMVRRQDAEQLRLRTADRPAPVDRPAREETEEVVLSREREIELRGRYRELQERVLRLKQELDAERRRSIRLELELQAAEAASNGARQAA
jgi:excisionase family DNA binding protein